jgi:1-acyl-sn-glycerol-3-phosphate acyltransferase
MNLYYRAWYHSFRILVPTLTRAKVQGYHNVPRTGPVILVSNHISQIDIPVLFAYVPRHIHFMSKAELFDQWPLSVILPPGKPIKVHRGRPDRQALRLAEDFLKAGEVIAIYAEGTRAKGGEAGEARAGAVFLAQRTGAPIVPVGVSGTEKIFSKRFPWYRRGEVQISFGKPFTLDELGPVTRANRDQVAQQVMGRVAELLPPAYRGVYERRQAQAARDAEAEAVGGER